MCLCVLASSPAIACQEVHGILVYISHDNIHVSFKQTAVRVICDFVFACHIGLQWRIQGVYTLPQSFFVFLLIIRLKIPTGLPFGGP